MIREQIQIELAKYGAGLLTHKLDGSVAECEAQTKKLVSLLCAEIEKIPNPFPQLDPDLTRQNPSLKQNQMGFEDCRQAILNKLKEGAE